MADSFVLSPVNGCLRDAIVRRVVENGGPDEEDVFIQGGGNLPEEIPAAKRRDLDNGWDIIFLMDPWVLAHYYGYDAHTVFEGR